VHSFTRKVHRFFRCYLYVLYFVVRGYLIFGNTRYKLIEHRAKQSIFHLKVKTSNFVNCIIKERREDKKDNVRYFTSVNNF